jgi:hypothetical protein
MPFPMIQWPMFAEFRGRLENEFSCEYKAISVKVVVNDGPPEQVRYIERTVDGTARRHVALYDDDERISPTEMRSICAHLEIDPSTFGLAMSAF